MVESEELPARTVTLLPESVNVPPSSPTVNDNDPLEAANVRSPA